MIVLVNTVGDVIVVLVVLTVVVSVTTRVGACPSVDFVDMEWRVYVK